MCFQFNSTLISNRSELALIRGFFLITASCVIYKENKYDSCKIWTNNSHIKAKNKKSITE